MIGLGYVGLPLAVALGRTFPSVVGFDISADRIAGLRNGTDRTGEVGADELAICKTAFTDDPAQLKDCTFFIVTVPTPVDDSKKPDLGPMISASETVGKALQKGGVVVYESTVYPGVTEDICRPILEKLSGLARGTDFQVGYSPERINPGDKKYRLDTIRKIIAAETPDALLRMEAVYGSVVKAGLYRCPSIREAEAAKVLENTQRDINIALMNEMAIICEKLGIRTREVLRAAGTKWNFLNFEPGLVGGHCVAVDPYYLSQLAQEKGLLPQVILAGRRVNDGMSSFIVQKTIRLMVQSGMEFSRARVGVLGMTFKENVPDIRSSLVVGMVREFQEFGLTVITHDPMADENDAAMEGIKLSPMNALEAVDALVLAVPHAVFRENRDKIATLIKPKGVFVDVRGAFYDNPPSNCAYWSL
ncbi:MAG TPA: nucleotide sugar dehydrogenase [Micavibrio sp.]